MGFVTPIAVAAAVLAGLIATRPVVGGELIPGYRVACPAYWPGLDAQGIPLDNRPGDWTPTAWDGFTSHIISNDDGSLESTNDIQLDCRYRGNRHLTIMLPGKDIFCQRAPHPDAPKVNTLVCETRAATECRWINDPSKRFHLCERREGTGWPGPYQIYIAEPVTADTALLGLKLRQSRETIRAFAQDQGYSELTGDRAADRQIVFMKKTERIKVLFSEKTGLAKRIEFFKERVDIKPTFHDLTVLRFGLPRRFINRANEPFTSRWSSADNTITFDLVSDWPVSNTAILTDQAAPD